MRDIFGMDKDAGEFILQVTAPHFVAGVVVRDDEIIKAAPILGWARGRSLGSFQRYCAEKRWETKKL